MNFDVSKSKVIPFTMPESEVYGHFIDFLIEGDNTPVDVAAHSKIVEKKKQFYPIRCFDITYSAEWQATSIWEKEEYYTEIQTKTVYIDYFGKEHDSPGYDYFSDRGGIPYSSGNIGGKNNRPWRAMPKQESVQKKRTVIDHVEPRYGDIGRYRSFQPIITYLDADQKLAQWVVSFLKKNKYVDYRPELLEDSEIKDLISSNDFARKKAEANVGDIARKQCNSDIPGDRYEDFQYRVSIESYSMQIVLVPIYHISYEYRGQKYECWLGGKADSDIFCYSKPQDEGLAAERERIAKEFDAQKSKKEKLGIISFVALPFALVCGLMWILAALTGERSPTYPFLCIASIVAEIILRKRYRTANKKSDQAKQALANRQAFLSNQKAAIASIVKDPKLSEKDKRQAVQKLLGQK